jgi:hypothetical protein
MVYRQTIIEAADMLIMLQEEKARCDLQCRPPLMRIPGPGRAYVDSAPETAQSPRQIATKPACAHRCAVPTAAITNSAGDSNGWSKEAVGLLRFADGGAQRRPVRVWGAQFYPVQTGGWATCRAASQRRVADRALAEITPRTKSGCAAVARNLASAARGRRRATWWAPRPRSGAQ